MEHDKEKILVVDDDLLIRNVLSEILKSRGYAVEIAKNGKEALDMYHQNLAYQLIISDMNMPEMSGIEMIKKLREIDVEIPIIILSGNDEISTAMEALNKGANDYLLKDENIQDTIFISIDRVLEKQALEKENLQLMSDLTGKNAELEKFNETLSQTIAKLTKIGTALSAEKNLEKLLEMIVLEARSITKTEIGLLYIFEEEQLRVNIFQKFDYNLYMEKGDENAITYPPIDLKSRFPEAICFTKKEIVFFTKHDKKEIIDGYETVNESSFKLNFSAGASGDEVDEKQIKSSVVIPMLDRDGEVLGVLALKNSRNPENQEMVEFHKNDIAIAYSLTSQAAVCIENTRNYQQIEKKKDSFQRFVPTEFLSYLGKKEIEDVALGDASHENLSVLFLDIRSFTALSESMIHSEIFTFLNDYLRMIGPALEKYGGFIDKFIGDAILALFPGTIINTADDAIHAAIEIQSNLKKFNLLRMRNQQPPVSIGIGIHTGSVTLGTIGFENRMETTVIGDTVNLASRMEGLTKQYGISIAVTSATIDRLANPTQIFYREVDTVKVKGKNIPITFYDIFEGDIDSIKEKKIVVNNSYNEALNLYKQRQWEEALKLLTEIRKTLDTDKTIQIYIKQCQDFIENPPVESWDGITTLYEK